jgi:hypothetical protein
VSVTGNLFSHQNGFGPSLGHQTAVESFSTLFAPFRENPMENLERSSAQSFFTYANTSQ